MNSCGSNVRSRFKGRKLSKLKMNSKNTRIISEDADKVKETSCGNLNKPQIFKVIDNLYMSGYQTAKNLDFLKQNKINHIVNLTSQSCENIHLNDLEYSSFKLSDNAQFNLSEILDNIIQVISDQISQGKSVLVHCKMGISRAPSIIIAYLIKIIGRTYNQAFDEVQKIDPKISPNVGYLFQLESL